MKNQILFLLCSFFTALLGSEVCHAQTLSTPFEDNMALADYSYNPNSKTLAERIAAREQLTNLATVYLTVPDAEGKNINDVLFKDRVNNIADYHQTTIQVVENECNDGTGRALGSFSEAGLLETDGSHKGLMIDYAAHKMMKNFFVALWTQEWFRLGVIKKWNALADAGLLSTLKEKSTAISATLAHTQPKNAERWSNSLGDFSTYSASVSAIGTYLDKRFEYLDKKFNELAYDEVTVSTLTHAIELQKHGKLTEADINAIVDKLLERK